MVTQMVGAFRLFKQSAGLGYFADVGVDVVSTSSEGEPDVTLEMSNQAYVPTEWIAAAEQGCRDALAVLKTRMLLAGKSFQVRITRLVFTWVDTTADAVYAASYLAVATAAGVQSKFELYRDTQWRVRTRD